MTRRPMVAGNWKMYKTAGEGVILIQDMEPLVSSFLNEVEIVVCPPYTALKSVSAAMELDRLAIGLGAQDMYWETEGAFTGAIAPRMLADLLCDYVIVGHSERREHFGETDSSVNKKVHAVFAAGMVPILCVGESLQVREAQDMDTFVRGQVRAAIEGISAEQAAKLVIAYEPVWAIGTGRTPSPESANDITRTIRATVGAMFGQPTAMSSRVLYGGSVKPDNAREFFVEPDIDGALVGGASLEAESFAAIAEAAL